MISHDQMRGVWDNGDPGSPVRNLVETISSETKRAKQGAKQGERSGAKERRGNDGDDWSCRMAS